MAYHSGMRLLPLATAAVVLGLVPVATARPAVTRIGPGVPGSPHVAATWERPGAYVAWYGDDPLAVAVGIGGQRHDEPRPFLTLDGGRTWQATDWPRGLRASAIGSHPAQPGVLWAVAWPRDWQRPACCLLVSRDGGRTWRRSGSLPAAVRRDEPIGGPRVVPTGQPGVVLLESGGDAAVPAYRTGDGGRTWSVPRLRADIAWELRPSPRPRTVYAVDGIAERLARSDDGGRTFRIVARDTADVAVDPGAADVLVRVRASTGDATLDRSVDGGMTWAEVARAPRLSVDVVALARGVLAARFETLVGTPDGDAAGPVRAPPPIGLRSTDGGRTWRRARAVAFPPDLAIDGTGGALLPGGGLRATADAGIHIRVVASPGGPADGSLAGLVGPRPTLVGTGTRILAWTPAGWRPRARGRIVLVAQADGVTYGTAYGRLRRSSDGGRSWVPCGSMPLRGAMVSASGDTVVAIAAGGPPDARLVTSADGCRTWIERAAPPCAAQPVAPARGDDAILVPCGGRLLAIAPDDSVRVRAPIRLDAVARRDGHARSLLATRGSRLLASRDGGRTWRAVASLGIPPSGPPVALDARTILVGSEGRGVVRVRL